MARPPAEAATARPPVPPRKGPWTDQEDLQLVWFVRLFGERRWDFLAKESGLNRTGKSCRLRWVNYLHPGLKHGRMTPQEEHLILELHDKWGNRWSRIARRLPGRTDNEIKNYWRTHMRKKAQERKQSSSPSLSSLSASSNDVAAASSGKYLMVSGTGGSDGELKGYTMDQIWSEIALSESVSNLSFEEFDGSAACGMDCPSMNAASPLWEECSGPLWRMDDEDARMLSFHDCSLGA